MKTLILIFITVISFESFADEGMPNIEIGQTWSLEARSNKISLSNSKVLYYLSHDAYNTYQARIFSDWDRFSYIDSRNLIRLNQGDRIKILKTKHHNRIYQVQLLDGFEKNKKYFVIRDDLIKDFKLLEKIDE